jgi:hypothetical protein
VFWRTKKSEQNVQKNDAATETVSKALQAYSNHLYHKLKGHPNSELDKAKVLVSEAEKLIQDSGLARALSRLIAETWQWPAWSKRDNFYNYVHFPAEKVVATETKNEKGEERTIHFTFNGKPWSLMVVKKHGGFPGDYNFGSAELSASGKILLSGVITNKTGDEYFDWSFDRVDSFYVGDWMKELMEIEALINHGKQQWMAKFENDRILNASKKIKL